MAFDGMFTHAMIQELKNTLLGGRITKISQPYQNEVILTIRMNRKNYPLLLSAHPNYARIQITEQPYKNPPTPTNFTMTLRKYLDNAKLVDIKQLENDRVVYLSFETRNEIGDKLPLLLSIEIMNRYSNVILINQQSKKIIDTIKHVGLDQNRYRTLLPGATYRKPPKQDKINPFNGEIEIINELVKNYPNREVLSKAIQSKFQGFSKTTALQLADTLHIDDAFSPIEHFNKLLENADNPIPSFKTEGKNDFSFSNLGNDIKDVSSIYPTLSMLLDHYYYEKATIDRVHQQGAKLIHIVNRELKKNRNKLKKLTQELDNTKYADEYKIKGELLITYLYQVKRGMKEITLPNYYNNDIPIKISLSNQLGPSQNAQKYFKKYQKLKNSISYLNKQILITKNEISYFEEIQSQIELAQVEDLADIQLELMSGGYINKNNHIKKNKRRPKINSPETFWATDGTKISVGKNNLQNEKLTLHTANRNDYWLHAKNVPGSHVIIHTDNPSEETLLEAANLAAFYSKARNSSNVPVDYVQVRKIRKPNGTKPGYVIYKGQKTLYVTPKKEIVDKLNK